MELDISIHAVDHCNYYCFSCSDCSPILPKRVYRAEEYIGLFQKLETYCVVPNIYIMGGEPTLHPNLSDFISEIRKNTAETKITLITNGWWLNHHEKFDDVLSIIDALNFSPHPQRTLSNAEVISALDAIHDKYGIYAGWRWTNSFVVFETTDVPDANEVTCCYFRTCCQMTPKGLTACFRVAHAPENICSASFNKLRHTGVFDVMNGDESQLSEWLSRYPECCKYCVYWLKVYHDMGFDPSPQGA